MSVIYDITIDHPKRGTVTVRDSDDIRGDDLGYLRTGDILQGVMINKPNGDVWFKITSGLFTGDFFAAQYAGKIFARWELSVDTPPTAPPASGEITVTKAIVYYTVAGESRTQELYPSND